VADPGFTNAGKDEEPQAPSSSAVGARIEATQAPRGEVWGGGVPSPLGKGSGEGAMLP